MMERHRPKAFYRTHYQDWVFKCSCGNQSHGRSIAQARKRMWRHLQLSWGVFKARALEDETNMVMDDLRVRQLERTHR